MTTISLTRLAAIVAKNRSAQNLSQADIQERTGINRLMIGRLEKCEFLPSLPQLNKLAEVLNFSIDELLEDSTEQNVFMAMRGEAKNAEEEAGIERLFSMISFLKSQTIIRSKLAYGHK